MFGLLGTLQTIIGSAIPSFWHTALRIAVVAVAVRAITETVFGIKQRNSPTSENASLNVSPLQVKKPTKKRKLMNA